MSEMFVLQDPQDKKVIICDEKLKKIFAGKDRVGFLEIAKLIGPHFLWMKIRLRDDYQSLAYGSVWAIKISYYILVTLGLRTFMQQSSSQCLRTISVAFAGYVLLLPTAVQIIFVVLGLEQLFDASFLHIVKSPAILI